MVTIKEIVILWVIFIILILLSTSNKKDIETCIKNKNGYSEETCRYLIDK